MSGETERDPSGWTPDLLNNYLGEKIERDRQTGRERFWFVCVVVALGWNELQRRLVTLNHAHEAQVDTLAATVTSDKYESDKDALSGRLKGIEDKLIASDVRERSASDEASRAAGARAEQRSDQSGGATARRQGIALQISAAALFVTVAVALFSIYTLRHQTHPAPVPVPSTTTP